MGQGGGRAVGQGGGRAVGQGGDGQWVREVDG